ncbi:unnamed protein product [Trifolium pratense]|uniref:Uncharacterized protein n=1 Tax=Trifolium pratense TaxID=57577 RepID=A0ACB0IJ44_TRIPR|nr:unnamed protein product [Trifolium pratense]
MASDQNLQEKYALNAKVMVGSSVLLFILIIIVVLFRTYIYLCHHRRNRHRQFSQQSLTTTTFKEEKLDPSVLKSIPTFIFSTSASHRTVLDCAVCLSEFTDGDVCRTLPNCKHHFHSQCIDMWLDSHSNCPLCRTPVQPVTVQTHTEPFSVSGLQEPGEGCSSFLEPVGCPRKPFSVIVELPYHQR